MQTPPYFVSPPQAPAHITCPEVQSTESEAAVVHTIRPSFHGPSFLSLFSGCNICASDGRNTCAVFSRSMWALCYLPLLVLRAKKKKKWRSTMPLGSPVATCTPCPPSVVVATHANRAHLLVVVLQIDATPASGSGPLLVTAITGSVRPPARHCHRRVSAASCSSLPPPVSAASLPTCGFGSRVLALRFSSDLRVRFPGPRPSVSPAVSPPPRFGVPFSFLLLVVT